MGWFTKNEDEEPGAAQGAGGPPAGPPSAEPATGARAAEPVARAGAQPVEGPERRPAAVGASPSQFGESVDIEGSIEGHGDVVLRGRVRGSIHVSGALVIEETGRVQADVAAREVINAGTVEGNILAADRVQVGATGTVHGDIDAPSIVIDDGGGVEGFVQMEPPGGDTDDEPEFVPPPPIKRSSPAWGQPGPPAEGGDARPESAAAAPVRPAPITAPPPAAGPEPASATPGSGNGDGGGDVRPAEHPRSPPQGPFPGDASEPLDPLPDEEPLGPLDRDAPS